MAKQQKSWKNLRNAGPELEAREKLLAVRIRELLLSSGHDWAHIQNVMTEEGWRNSSGRPFGQTQLRTYLEKHGGTTKHLGNLGPVLNSIKGPTAPEALSDVSETTETQPPLTAMSDVSDDTPQRSEPAPEALSDVSETDETNTVPTTTSDVSDGPSLAVYDLSGPAQKLRERRRLRAHGTTEKPTPEATSDTSDFEGRVLDALHAIHARTVALDEKVDIISARQRDFAQELDTIREALRPRRPVGQADVTGPRRKLGITLRSDLFEAVRTLAEARGCTLSDALDTALEASDAVTSSRAGK